MANSNSRRRGIAALAFLALLLAGGCSTPPEIRSDIDPTADFGRYTTFNFFDPMGIEGGYNSPVYGEHFRASITRELQQRGYRMAENPDLWVNVSFRVDDKVKMRSYSSPYMSGHYYNRPGSPHYGTGVGVGVGVSSRATKVEETSVFIDLVDNEKDRMVWQGVAVVDASDKVAQQLKDATYTAVNMIFDQYPHRAGR